MNVAMIGVGCISGIYLKNIHELYKQVHLIGVCDLVKERALDAQKQYGIPKVYDTMYDAFNDPEVDVILNLTRPYEHFEVTKAALEHGKHVYTEKPLGACYDEGVKLAALAREKGLWICGAPDTFLGAGIQTCRKLIDGGMIGEPIGCAAFMICHGHETWHPDPDFYYQFGGGPIMDMGPYYITAMINLMGGIRRVFSASRAAFKERMITSQPFCGTKINVNVNTYCAGTLEFDSGAIGTLFATFDVYYPTQARFEVYGTEGTLIVPDPNVFGGPIRLFRPEDGTYRDIPLMYDYCENSRGLGLADMCSALESGRDARCDLQQIYHVLDALTAFDRSSEKGGWIDMSSKYTRRQPMVKAKVAGILD